MKGRNIYKTIDGRELRKVCVRLSILTFSDMENFMNLDLFELNELVTDVSEVVKK